jgi:deoxyribose-phosphate aldolase
MPSIARQELSRLIEHTLRKADLTRAELERACGEAIGQGFGSLCVNGSRVLQAVHFLEESEVKVTCAVAYPQGASDGDVKRYETEAAVDNGAHFIEVTANLGRLKDGDDAFLLRELRDVVEAADERPVSLFINSGLLTGEEIRRISGLARDAAVKGIAISSGVDSRTTLQAVRLVREVAEEGFGIKVEMESCEIPEIASLIEAGATRFGFAQGPKLIESLP